MNKLQTTIKITQLLNDSGCTYDEVGDFLFDIQQHYKQVREQKEYNTVSDIINGNKSIDIGNEIVDALNNVII